MSTVIQVENISKLYRLGNVGSGTLKDDLGRWWQRVRGKEDPLMLAGAVNDRTQKAESDYVWALKDINFEVQQGDVLGIIGRNGAGKSTLLKILSKTTAPTTGSVKLKGRIASLLEVGTGFHPELTGRENIYLNGAILGMRKHEITRKLDEIIDFAGVERYIDTPVKRYSSGMYVRLAFGVAAHLESEILIIDEVLAVGDAEFQKKCLGKMGEVSKGEGRTVLFVSHQTDAISRLCNRVLLCKDGKLQFNGQTSDGIRLYLEKDGKNNSYYEWSNNNPGNELVRLLKTAVMSNGISKSSINIKQPITVLMEYEILKDNIYVTPGINLFNYAGNHLFTSHDVDNTAKKFVYKKGKYISEVVIPGNFLAEGIVNISVAMMSYDPFIVHFHAENYISVLVIDEQDGTTARGNYTGEFPGLLRPKLDWNIKKNN